MTAPFDPPAEGATARFTTVVVAGAWALAGACAGTAVGTTLALTGRAAGSAEWGIGGLLLLGVAGLAAASLDARAAEGRPQVVDGRGRVTRPSHGGLYAVPIAIAAPSLAVLVLVGSVSAGSLLPAVVFSVGLLGLAWALRGVVARHRLAGALQALEAGAVGPARSTLQALCEGWATPGSVRRAARLNLGLVCMGEGDLLAAERLWAGIQRGQATAHARAGQALLAVLDGDFPRAEALLGEAQAREGGRGIQAQADAVRLLVVWRRDGEEAARALGEKLLGPESGPLLCGLLAALRRAGGDEEGAEAVCGPAQREGLRAAGLLRVVPELEAQSATSS